MRTVSMKNKPMIFPSYVKYLNENGVRFVIEGNKAADIELTRILFEAEIKEDRFDVLPEILMYDTNKKKWEEVCLEKNEQVMLIGNSGNKVVTYYEVTSIPQNSNILSILASFLMQFSAAKISFIF